MSGYYADYMKEMEKYKVPNIVVTVEDVVIVPLYRSSAECYVQVRLHNTTLLEADISGYRLKVKVGDKGQVFGGIHEKDIVQAINNKLRTTHFDKNQIDAHQSQCPSRGIDSTIPGIPFLAGFDSN